MKEVQNNAAEYLSPIRFEDLCFYRVNGSDLCWTRPELEAINLNVVDYGNGCWHFAQRVNAMNGFGRMIWLDDLIKGFEFVTGGQKLIK